jgi:hypothetical protein
MPAFAVRNQAGAGAAEEFAAEELRRHLSAMLGAGTPLRYRFNKPEHILYINDREAAVQAGIAPERHPSGVEEFLIETAGADVHILGGGPRGVLYGVYHLLESLGCRWFTPDVSRIPKVRHLRLPALSVHESPAFVYRDNMNWDTGDPLWRLRNRFNGWYTPLPAYMGGNLSYAPGMFVHTHFGLLDPREQFGRHPEYAAMINGVRQSHAGQLCMTNPEVVRLVTEAVMEQMRLHPDSTLFSVSQMDGGGACECPSCRAATEEDGSGSGPVLRLANAVAEATSKVHPEKLIDTLAYCWSLDAPRVTRPHPNVRVRLCSIVTCMAHPLGSCGWDLSAQFMRALEGWSRITSQMHIWHYCTNFSHTPLPMPDFDQTQGSLRLFRDRQVFGVFMQGFGNEGGGAESQELRGYLTGKLLWNPDATLWPYVDDFLSGVFGAAAVDVRRYYDLFHDRVRAERDLHFTCYEPPSHRLYEETLLDKAGQTLAAAQERVTDAAARRRVRLLQHGVDYARLMRGLPARFRCEEDRYTPDGDVGALRGMLNGMARDYRRAGVLYLSEWRPLVETVPVIRQALASHRLVWLRHGGQAIAVTPTLGAHIAEWHCRGRQWMTWPMPEDFRFPSPAGYMEIPGHCGERFRCRIEGNRLIATGRLSNGLAIRRVYTLEDDALKIESVFRNEGEKPVDWSWGGRTFLLSPDPVTVEFDAGSGPVRIGWDDIPQAPQGFDGARCFEQKDYPIREWQVCFPQHTLTHRFSGHPFIRTKLGRSDARQGLMLYVATDNLRTGPGDGIALTQELLIKESGDVRR